MAELTPEPGSSAEPAAEVGEIPLAPAAAPEMALPIVAAPVAGAAVAAVPVAAAPIEPLEVVEAPAAVAASADQIAETSGAVEPRPASAEWSIPAAASLVCGVFLIVPYLAGVAAIALGIVGIRQVNLWGMRGRAMARGGLLLGFLNLLGWTGYFWLIGHLSGPGRSVAREFIFDLNNSSTAAARQICLPGVQDEKIAAAEGQIKSWGGVSSVAVLSIATGNDAEGTNTASVRGALWTPSGQHLFQLDTINQKVSGFVLQ
jgi:hypothetical protein